MEERIHNAQGNAEVDYSSRKIYSLAIFGILCAAGFSYALSSFFTSFEMSWFWGALATATAFLIVIFLQALFIKEISRLSSIIFFQTIALIVVFIADPSEALLIGTLLTFTFLFWGSVVGLQEMQANINIRTWRVASITLPKAVTALSFLIAAVYISGVRHGGALISEDTFLSVVLPADVVVTYFYPDISLTDSFKSAADKMVTRQFAADPLFANLPARERDLFLAKAVGELKKKVETDYLNISFSDSESIVGILYKAFTNYVENVPAKNQTLVFMVFGLVLFLVIRGFGTPFHWLVMLFAVFAYELLRAAGFVTTSYETRSKEILIVR